MGTVKAICYKPGGPPHLPNVQFDSYSGPTMHDGTVPIVPIRRSWTVAGATCSRLQIPSMGSNYPQGTGFDTE